jgi:hypothetical protein
MNSFTVLAGKSGLTASADTAAAGHILGDELLAELLAQVLRQQPGSDVVDAARRERHQDPHRLVRIVLCLGRRRQRQRQAGGGEQSTHSIHCHSSQSSLAPRCGAGALSSSGVARPGVRRKSRAAGLPHRFR